MLCVAIIDVMRCYYIWYALLL